MFILQHHITEEFILPASPCCERILQTACQVCINALEKSIGKIIFI